MIISLVFVISASYFAMLNIWSKIPLIGNKLPTIMALKTFNPAANSAEGLAIYLAYMTAFLIGLILINKLKKEDQKTIAAEGEKESRSSFLMIQI